MLEEVAREPIARIAGRKGRILLRTNLACYMKVRASTKKASVDGKKNHA